MHLFSKTIQSTVLTLGCASLLLFANSCKSEKTVSDRRSGSVSQTDTTSATAIDSGALRRLVREKDAEMASYQQTARRDFDLLHTDLDLSFDWGRQAVLGKAILTLKPYIYPQDILVLDAKDFETGAVYLIQGDDRRKLGYRYDEKQLTINLPEKLTAKDTFLLEINYTAFPERNAGNGSMAITDNKGLYFIDPLDTIPGKPTMIWTQGETEHNSKWFPTIDKPNERATQLFKLTVPDTLVTIGNGVLIKQEALGNGLRKDYWELKLPSAPYLAAFAIGDFGKVEAKAGDIPLGYYVEKGFEKGAAKVFQHTPEMIAFFEDILGVKYPWPKYDQVVVRDFVSGAMENTTVSIFMEELRLNERDAIDSEWDYIIAHELFHQWFGDYVTTESWSNLPLNEGFANYSEYLWNEYKYGADEASLKLVSEMEGYFSEAETKQVDLIRFDYADSEDMFDSHSYNKSGIVLHMLRRHLGDEVFFGALNEYLQRYAFQSVEVHDLRLAFERYSGQDLNWFFNQWFLDKGHPELHFEVDYSQPENILVSVFQAQDLNDLPLFQLPIELSWYEDGTRKSKTFQMTQTFQQFSLENETPVTQVYIDEGKNLLAKRYIDASSEQYARQYKESQLGVARYEALDSLVAQAAHQQLVEIVPLALSDPFWAIRENALGYMQSDSVWNVQFPDIENKVIEMAEKDPRNSVRSAALDLLTSWDADKYQGVFRRLANDPSYLVAGSALTGLVAGKNAPVDLELVDRFSDEASVRIAIPVAEYYIGEEVPGKGEWFLNKLRSFSGEGLYYFMGYFSEYFIRNPEEGKDKAVAELLSVMKTESKNYLRLGSFQALLGFADDEAIIKEVGRIAGMEKDPELKNYYNYFLEAFQEEN
jgi:aminopeptidase N